MRNALPLFVALFSLLFAGRLPAQETVRIYCSLDQEHSEPLLRDFEKETGIKLETVFDTEANKTVGLVRRLLAEKNEPYADVYWNNELATTIKLKLAGVLQAYKSKSAADIPAVFKDPDGHWTGFAARARVLIVNTNRVKPDEMPTTMWDLADPKWRGKVAMARPQTGTTATHAAALYVLDSDEADRYFKALIDNEVVWRPGNGHVMREVADGLHAFGWTDTDDFHVALLARKPVAKVYPDKGPDDLGVMYIPNSIMLIKGAPNPAGAKRLIDWVLRPETEARLAKSATAQIPVRPGVAVPDHVRRPDQVGKTMAVDFLEVGRQYDRWVSHVQGHFSEAEAKSGSLPMIFLGVLVAAVLAFLLLKKATGEPT
ncbi:MAG: extracellular solute-binding protein [Planctomycetota bacterium]